MKTTLIAAAFALVLALGAPARANTGYAYVCDTDYLPANAGVGTYGYLYVDLYSQPACAGNYLRSYVVCSTGGTGSYCTANGLYSEAALQGLMHNLVLAAHSGHKVFYQDNSAAFPAFLTMTFYGN